jgi:hypothetical protein
MVALLFLSVGCGDKEDTSQPTAASTTTPPVAPSAPERATTPPAAPDPAAEGTAVVSDPTFELRAEGRERYASGELAQFSVTLTPRAGWHVNQDYPTRIEITGPAAVSFPKSELQKADAAQFAEERARFDVPFTPSAPGTHTIQAKVSFAVCTDETCVPDTRTLALALPVQ